MTLYLTCSLAYDWHVDYGMNKSPPFTDLHVGNPGDVIFAGCQRCLFHGLHRWAGAATFLAAFIAFMDFITFSTVQERQN